MLSYLNIDADNVVEDRHRFASAQKQQKRLINAYIASDGCVEGYPDAHIEDYRHGIPF